MMPVRPKPVLAAGLVCALLAGVGSAQQAGAAGSQTNRNHSRKSDRTLTQDDGLAVLSAALDPKVRRYAGNDCSHLVHAIYERAGFPYAYASSDDLYDGVEGFRRIAQPQPGDLIVWHGHVGIVVRPSRHVFYSFMSAGPGIDNYKAPYWIGRGAPRFYRYVKNNSCPGCTSITSASHRTHQN